MKTMIAQLRGDKTERLRRRSHAVYAVLGAVCVLLLVGSRIRAEEPQAALTPMFVKGNEGYACFRIPAIVRTPAGTLLAFAEARRNSCNDFGDVRIVMRKSIDEGRSWGPLAVVAENGSLQAGNAAPVVDTMDKRFRHGRILLVYCTGDAPEGDVMRGKGSKHVWYRTSTDDGVTWSQPVEITASVKLPTWRGYATTPGHALQLTHGPHAGRIVVAANHSEGDPQPAGRAYDAHAFYSDDHGASWHLGDSLAWPGSNESTAAEAADGTVVMNSRDQSGVSRARIIGISKDGGAKWNSVFIAADLPDPVCEGSMISYKDRKGQALLFSNAGNKKTRSDLTVSVSRDGGHTWPRRTLLSEGPAAYSDMVMMKGGRLGILWERGSDDGIFFMVRPVAPLL
ncbi:MAG: exo-alpha-sialidase [Acidobacteria bacterium]|nr:exo-alpha-sialidase [Acidobacteriota bacterium]